MFSNTVCNVGTTMCVDSVCNPNSPSGPWGAVSGPSLVFIVVPRTGVPRTVVGCVCGCAARKLSMLDDGGGVCHGNKLLDFCRLC